MKMSMVGVCSALALCLAAGTAQAGPNPGAPAKNKVKAKAQKNVAPARTLQVAKPEMVMPVKVAGIRKMGGGKYALTTPWYNYNGGSGKDFNGELAFDALQVDATGAPIGGSECGLPGDGYRWYFGQDGYLPWEAEDMQLDSKFNGSQSEGLSYLFWWTNNNTGLLWYVGIFTFDKFGHNCAEPYADEGYDGILLAYNPLGTGFYYSPVDLAGYGLFWQMPVDGDGGYEVIFADAFDGQFLYLAANPCHQGLYGTADAGGLPGRPGKNTKDMWADGWNNPPDAVMSADDCADLAFGLCPDPLANGTSFWANPGGGEECYPDCNGDKQLDFFDFLCFSNDFNQNGSYSNCVADGQHDLFDFLCYVNSFNEGCK